MGIVLMTTSHFLSRSTYALALIVVVTIVFGLHACARTDSDSTASEPLSIAMLNEREILFSTQSMAIFSRMTFVAKKGRH